ncbi:hypothetical protein RAS1_38140 [Phycisphaerae bacterium RAS1]|nr:hypothetical protein RAS1_38140 [Phycisphaerae bacterium RAS1]
MAKAAKKNPTAPATSTAQPVSRIQAAPAPGSSSGPISADQIRKRAYEIYLRRNGGPGDPTADWLTAERELLAERR